jgi:hypothetical protein
MLELTLVWLDNELEYKLLGRVWMGDCHCGRQLEFGQI